MHSIAIMVGQKVPIDGIKKKTFKNINLADYFFLSSIFEPLYFLKSCPIFVKGQNVSRHIAWLAINSIHVGKGLLFR